MQGTEIQSPHGLHIDLLDRMIIIRTMPYILEELVQIINFRASTEKFTVHEDALSALGEVNTSM